MEKSMDMLSERLFRMEMLLHRYYHHNSRGKTENPHKGQGRVLKLLYKCGQISQRELPYLLDMRQQSVSELLLKLEKKGLIERSVPGGEKRETTVQLTEEGRAASEAAEAERSAAGAEDLFSCLRTNAEFLKTASSASSKRWRPVCRTCRPGTARTHRTAGHTGDFRRPRCGISGKTIMAAAGPRARAATAWTRKNPAAGITAAPGGKTGRTAATITGRARRAAKTYKAKRGYR